MSISKKCSKCRENKLFSEFSKNKSNKDGLQEQCKLCNRLWRQLNKEALKKRHKEYYETNKKALLEKQKEYAQNNKEIIVKRKKIYRDINKEKITAQSKIWRETNKEKIKNYHKIYCKVKKEELFIQQKNWREKNKEHIAKRKQDYLKNNFYKHAANSAKRRATKKQATPAWADLEEIKNVYLEAEYFGMHVDHIVPLQSNIVCGLHVWENLQLLPPSKNISKGNRYWPDMP